MSKVNNENTTGQKFVYYGKLNRLNNFKFLVK